jgi:hypothetical protein
MAKKNQKYNGAGKLKMKRIKIKATQGGSIKSR